MVVKDKKPTIKEKIAKEFGSINKFVDLHYNELGLSRTYLYALLNKEDCNPTVDTLHRLAVLTKIPVEEVFDEYSMRYRNTQPSDKHDN